ncbi:MAG: DNA primase [Lachnospiraceae bacterium]
MGVSYYSDDLVEEVRSRSDIVDVISSYVKLQKKGSTYFGLCPFHNEKSPSFSVSQGKQMYYCFGCGAGGNVFTFLMEYENYTFLEAMEFLAERAGIDLPKQEMSQKEQREADKKTRILAINREAARYFYVQLGNKQGQPAKEYLKNRNLTEETLKKFGLGFSEKAGDQLYRYFKKQGIPDDLLKDSGLFSIEERRGGYCKFWNRVMFPIMDVKNHVIGFGGRVLGEGEPKYLNSPETPVFDKGRNLYGLNFARISKRQGLLLCEGYMDVIALHQAGFDNGVASLGTAFTAGHANLMKRYTKEVYLTFDSDTAGVKAALRAIPILKEAQISAKVVNMAPYKDPDEFIKHMGAEAYQERIDQAEDSFIFELKVLQKNYNMSDPQSKTGFCTEIGRKLLEFSQELEREIYLEAAAEEFFLDKENLRKLVNHLGTQIGITAQRKPPLKSGMKEQKKEDGMQQSQKLLLTWLIEDIRLFEVIKDYISPKDFTEDLFHKVAVILFEQYEKGEVNPAKIISLFEQEEEQRTVASLFNARLQDIDTKQEKEKALKETIIRIKANGIAAHSKSMEATDIQTLMQVVEDKRKLQELEKMHISID